MWGGGSGGDGMSSILRMVGINFTLSHEDDVSTERHKVLNRGRDLIA